MKTTTLFIALILLGFCSYSQTQKVTVYCELYNGIAGLRIDYGDLGKFLPDSLKTAVLKDSIDKYDLLSDDITNVLLLMGADGWKVSVSIDERGSYLLSKEISMDGPTRQLYYDKIMSSLNKPKAPRPKAPAR